MLDNLAYLFIGTALVILITVVVLKKTTKPKDPKGADKPKKLRYLVLPTKSNDIFLFFIVILLLPTSLTVMLLFRSPRKEENKPKLTYGPIHLYFGSQTGTAANFCKILAEEAANNNFQPIVSDLQEFDPDTIVTPKVAVFCMATHGEGEPTDNAEHFYKWISAEDRELGILKDIRFTVFGLGNKQYQFFNAMGKKTDALIGKLGGERIYRYGEGDDDGSLEDDFNEWKTNLWKELKEKIKPVEADQLKKAEEQFPFNLVIVNEELKEVDLDNFDADSSGKEYDFQAKSFLTCKQVRITKAYELRQNNDEGSTLHIEFETGSSGLKYQTAANLMVFPENDPKFVEEIAQRVGAKLDQTFIIEENKENISSFKFSHPVPSPVSVRTYLSRFCDLQGPLKKSTLKKLAKFVDNEEKKQKFLRLATVAGKDEYEAEIAKPLKGLYDIIVEHDIKLNLQKLISVADTIKPRYFTIASSSLKHPDTIHVCASLLEFKIAGDKWRPGLVSGYFRRVLEHFIKDPGTPLYARVNVKDSTFYLPLDSNRPLVLVGPGAGLAPFRGFLHEKEHLIVQGENKRYGEITLYFGCRKSNSDYIYKDELETFQKLGIINRYFTAFSRESDEKCYVQDLMKKHSEELGKTIFDQNGSLYICGSIRMGNDVMKVFEQIASEHLKVPPLEGALRVKELEQDKRIIKELWE